MKGDNKPKISWGQRPTTSDHVSFEDNGFYNRKIPHRDSNLPAMNKFNRPPVDPFAPRAVTKPSYERDGFEPFEPRDFYKAPLTAPKRLYYPQTERIARTDPQHRVVTVNIAL